jgi:4-amino-4-deoxy-L-arabinose transferase-like glycosyltransferase
MPISSYRKRLLTHIILGLIIIAGAVFRLYQLGSIPAGLANDEANTGYDAYSLLITGKDQWAESFPLISTKGFGDYPPVLYRYLVVPAVAAFGLNEFSIRLPSAIFGTISIILVYLIGKRLWGIRAGLAAALCMSLMPWAVGLSRVGIESNVALTFLLGALVLGLRKELSVAGLFGAVILLGLSAYTYTAYLLFAPLTYGILVFLHINKDKKRLIQLTLATMLCIILFTPFILQKAGASVRVSQVGILSNINSVGIMNEINEKRGECLGEYMPLICKLLYNAPLVFSTEFIKHYLTHFSTDFLYLKGTQSQFSILPQRGLDYLLSGILLFAGVCTALRSASQKRTTIGLIVLFLLSPIPDSLTGSGHFSRAAMMQPFLALFSGLGAVVIISSIGIQQIRRIFALLLLSVYAFGAIWFFITYTSYFKDAYSIYSQYGYRQLMTEISHRQSTYDAIYISRKFNDTKHYAYYLFYTRYDPLRYQTKHDVLISEENGWISVDMIDNVYFVQSLPELGSLSHEKASRILLVSHPTDFDKKILPEFTIRDRLGNRIFLGVLYSRLLEKTVHD